MTVQVACVPKVIVVMPAFNAAKTLWHTYEGIPRDMVSEVILVDDASSDATVTLAQRLETIPFLRNSHDFDFDTQVLVQAVTFGFTIAEIPVTTKYFKEASSVNFTTSVRYGLKTLWALGRYHLHKGGLLRATFLSR